MASGKSWMKMKGRLNFSVQGLERVNNDLDTRQRAEMGQELVVIFHFSISEGRLEPVEACPVESPLTMAS